MIDAQPILSSALIGAAICAFCLLCRDYYFRGLSFVEDDFRAKLRRLRIPAQNLRRWLVLWTLVILATAVGLAFGAESVLFALMAASLLACLPWLLLRRMARRYKERVEDQLADGMASFSSAIKAGLSIAQGLELLSDQGPRPMRDEFRQIVGEYHMGKPLERTLEEAKRRLQSDNFALFAAALLASRESGGRLNETVDRIAQSVVEMQRLERKIRSETAQARLSALYMALAPALILLMYYFIDPVNTALLFTSVPGQIILSIALILNVVAYVWARRILNPDI